MPFCPNLSNPKVKQEFNELVSVFGETAAYDLWHQNNGYHLDKTPTGEDSILFKDILALDYVAGDRKKALVLKANAYGKGFMSSFGNWINFEKPTSLQGTAIKKGVDELFESNPELASIGSQQLYSQYLDSLNKPNTNPILQGNQQEQVKKFAELQERLNNKEFIEGAKNAYESSKGLQEWGTQGEYNDYIARVSLGIIKNPTSGGYNYTSKVKDIVYHGTPYKFDRFKGISFFSDNFDDAEELGIQRFFHNELTSKEKKELEMRQYRPGGAYSAFQGALFNYYVNENKRGHKEGDYEDAYKYIKESGILDRYLGKVNTVSVIINAENLTESDKPIHKEDLIKRTKTNEVIKGKDLMPPLGYKRDDIVYAVFEPEQIHILSSKQDIEGFREFVQNKQSDTDVRLDSNGEPLIEFALSENPKSGIYYQLSQVIPLRGNEPLYKDYNLLNSNGKVKQVNPNSEKIKDWVATLNLSPYYAFRVCKCTDGNHRIFIVNKRGMFQSSIRSTAEANEKLNDMLKQWAAKFGIKVEALEKYAEKYDQDATGVADMLEKLILISQGKQKKDTLPEEIAHFAIEMLGVDHPLVKAILNKIENTDIYKEVVEEYGETYNNDVAMLKKEAAGKLLAKYIIGEYDKTWLSRQLELLWNRIKQIFSKANANDINKMREQALSDIAKSIINNNDIGYNVNNIGKDKYLQKEKTESKEQQIKDSIYFIEKIMSILKGKLEIYEERGKEQWTSKTKKNIAQLEEAREKGEVTGTMLKFISNASEEINNINNKLFPDIRKKLTDTSVDNIRTSSKQLRDILNYVSAYKPIIEELEDEIHSIMVELEDLGKSVEEEENIRIPVLELKDILGNIKEEISKAEREYSRIGKILFSSILKQHSFRDDLDVLGIINEAQKDLSWFQRMFDGLADCPNDILMLVDKMVKYSKDDARRNSVDMVKNLIASHKKLMDSGIKDTKFMYEIYNGKITGNLVTKYNQYEFYIEKKKFFDEIESLFTKGEITIKEKSKRIRKWYKENTIVDPDYEITIAQKREYFYEKYGEKEGETLTEEWIEDNVLRVPRDKYLNKQYADIVKNKAMNDYYDNYMTLKRQMDALIPPKYAREYRAVQIRKDFIERIVSSDKKLAGTWESIKEMFVRTEDETEFGGNVITDERGNPQSFLPLHFVNRIENTEHLSLDATSSLAAYISVVNDYNEMSKIIDILEIGKDIVADMDVNVKEFEGKSASGFVKSVIGKNTITRKAKEGSKIYDRLIDYMNMQVYGKYKKNEGKIGKLDFAMTVDAFGKLVSLNGLALNIYSGFQNVIYGGAMERIEGFAKEYVNHKDLLKADAIWSSNIFGAMGDIGALTPQSKLGLWYEMTNVLQDYETEMFNVDAARKTRLSRVLNGNIFYVTNSAGEHYLQGRMSLALANALKLKDKNGKEITLWDAYEVKKSKDGVNRLVLQEGITKADGSKFTSDDLNKFIHKQHAINQRLHGIYNKLDRSAAQQYALWRQALIFRKFIKPGWNRRWAKMSANEMLEGYTEGFYNTTFRFFRSVTFRFLSSIIKDSKGLQLYVGANWNNLSPTEKANILRGVTEIGYMVAAGILIAVLDNLDPDDDDDWFYNMLSYQAHRMLTELRFYSNPNDALTILKTPAAAVNQIENVIDICAYVLSPWNWDERYKAGKYKDQLKITKTLREMIPAYRNINGWFSPEEKKKYFQGG